MVVLDVPGSPLRDRCNRVERDGALELAEDRVVGPAEVVGQHVQPPAVGHPDDDLRRPLRRRELDQLVEHRHGHVEALDRKLVLAEVGLVHEPLECVDLDEPLQEETLLFLGEWLAEGPGLDVLAQPHALTVGGDVLDLVGDRPAVGPRRWGRESARVSPGTYICRMRAGIRAITSGVRPSGSGSSVGSPFGSLPSGSRWAARWPVRPEGLQQGRRRLDGFQHPLVDVGQRPPLRDRAGGELRRDRRRERRWRTGARPERSEGLLVEVLRTLSSSSTRARKRPDSAPWITRWS